MNVCLLIKISRDEIMKLKKFNVTKVWDASLKNGGREYLNMYTCIKLHNTLY